MARLFGIFMAALAGVTCGDTVERYDDFEGFMTVQPLDADGSVTKVGEAFGVLLHGDNFYGGLELAAPTWVRRECLPPAFLVLHAENI